MEGEILSLLFLSLSLFYAKRVPLRVRTDKVKISWWMARQRPVGQKLTKEYLIVLACFLPTIFLLEFTLATY